MRLVIDMNLSPAWKEFLRAAGHDAIHWMEIGPLNAPDSEIAAWAYREKRVVLTHDLDFGALLAATRAIGPSVIQMRTDDLRPSTMGQTLLGALQMVEDQAVFGFLITVDPRRHRLTLLPLRR